MTNPIADEVVRLADGRILAWSEWGDPRGTPVVFLHCSPGSRLLCPDPEATEAADVRLITIDRPGYGRSEPTATPTITAFAEDVRRLIDHLWLGQVPIVGWSHGGHYAAACAALLGERVNTVALLATPAPPPGTPGAGRSPDAAGPGVPAPDRAVEVGPDIAATLARSEPTVPAIWNSPADRAIRADPGHAGALAAMWAEAFRTGPHGLAADVRAESRPWGFACSHVEVPAVLFYGADDQAIGLEHGRWWADALPRSTLTVVPACGNLVPLAAWPDILSAVTR